MATWFIGGTLPELDLIPFRVHPVQNCEAPPGPSLRLGPKAATGLTGGPANLGQ